MTREGGTGVVVPGWQLLVRGQLSPFLFVFGIFFCLVPARWHFVTDFSICLSDGKGIGWGDFDSAWGFALQNVPTSYSLRKVKNKIEDFRVSAVIKMRWNLFLCSSGSDGFLFIVWWFRFSLLAHGLFAADIKPIAIERGGRFLP